MSLRRTGSLHHWVLAFTHSLLVVTVVLDMLSMLKADPTPVRCLSCLPLAFIAGNLVTSRGSLSRSAADRAVACMCFQPENVLTLALILVIPLLGEVAVKWSV